jgi:enoyl-CoA hydratase/carnithine racemase
MSDYITYAKDGPIASIRFNRPEKKNAITAAMYQSMVDGFDDAASDGNVRALAILGGDNVFTAGNDIADFLAAGSAGAAQEDLAPVKFLRRLASFPKPLVAGVKGVAVGIGVTMLMHCDAVVLGRSARLTMPFTKLGLSPEGAATLLFPLIAGRMRASWLLLSGDQFGADEALDMGFATRVVEDADVDATVLAMCGQLADLPPNSVAGTKRLIRAAFPDFIDRVIGEEVRAFTHALTSDEARAAFMKFMSRA